MKMDPKWLVVLLAVLFAQVEAAKILGVFWTFSRSHHIAGSALVQGLARAGHEVHLLSPFTDKVDIPTFKQEALTGVITPGDENASHNISIFTKLKNFIPLMTDNTEKFWQNEAIQKLIKTKPKYDVIIVLTFFNDFVLALSHYLEAPAIIFGSMGSNVLNNKFVGNPNLPYTPAPMVDGTMDSFVGRLNTVSFNAVLSFMERFVLQPMQDGINKKYLPDSPPVEDLVKNVSLVLINSHFVIEGPKPYVPNMIQIGGFHSQQVKKLPENIQKYLDSAKDGAILFSLGTNVKIGKNLGKDQLDAIMTGLGKVAPVKVLFKSEIEIPTAPKNVLVSNWLPQNDILAHPNIKVFISHGGLGGTTEAVFHGVPMLGIPFFADQKANVGSILEAGFCVVLEVDNITQETFEVAIKELLSNPKYLANAKKRSSLLKNQPVTALDKAIWWVEHIIEHKGGEHLRNVGMELEWYQLYMVDVMLFFIAVISLVLAVSFFVTRWLFRKLWSVLRGKPKKVKKVKKQ